MLIRQPAWTPCGNDLFGATSVNDALTRAGVNFEVEKQKIYLNKGGMRVIDDQFANVRSDNGEVLGIVTGRYQIVQNAEAFAFADNLVPEGVEFERGGAFHNGRAVWVQAKLPNDYKVLGEDIEAHVVFVNSHDGKGSVRIAVIPNRLFCSNQLNFALKHANRSWSAKHSVTIEDRIREAQDTLGLSDAYMKALDMEMNELAVQSLTLDQFDSIIKGLYPVDEPNITDRVKASRQEVRNGIMECYEAPDVAIFKGTKYGATLALTDYFDHREPQRVTNSFEDLRWQKVIGGHPDIDKMVEAIRVA